MNILLIRAEPAALRSADRIRSAGHQVVRLPMLAYRILDEPIGEGPFDAVLFTSAAAPKMLGERPDSEAVLSRFRDVPAYCTGAATATAARELGLANHIDCGGDARSVAARIRRDIQRGKLVGRPRLLHFGGRHRATDFRGALPGGDVHVCVIYEACLVDPGRQAFHAALETTGDGAVFLYSPRSCAHFFHIAERHALVDKVMALTLIGISQNVAESAPEWAKPAVVVANSPNETAMLAMLETEAG